jgi:predicted RNA binding protein YcfA (HicA-like mRNA interferase family)
MHSSSIMRILTYLLTLTILGSLGGCVVRERGYHHHYGHPTTVIIRH